MGLEELIRHYGYWALVAGSFLEGETIVVAGGLAAHRGYLDLSLVILASFAGSLAGDQFYFFIGRFRGKAFLSRRPGLSARVSKAKRLVDRYGNLIGVGFRFVYGFRTVTPFAMGLSDFPVLRFAILNTIGALAWAIAIGCLGFFFGVAAETLLANIKLYERWLFVGLLAMGASVWIVRTLVRRKGRRPGGNG